LNRERSKDEAIKLKQKLIFLQFRTTFKNSKMY